MAEWCWNQEPGARVLTAPEGSWLPGPTQAGFFLVLFADESRALQGLSLNGCSVVLVESVKEGDNLQNRSIKSVLLLLPFYA